MADYRSCYQLSHYDEAADYVRRQTTQMPSVGLILGSGLSTLAEQMTGAIPLPYTAIPHFPVSTVAGHAGRFVIGGLAGVPVCVMQGRFHFYEGYSMQQITLPIRVMQRLGVQILVLTNAAGGLNQDFTVGDLMLIEDHINLPGMAGQNPLRGPNLDEFGDRFPAANHIYTRILREHALAVAGRHAIPLQRGVYVMLAGPNYESPAEIRFLRAMGADAVGMSTVPEALVAHHAGMRVLAISTITNMAIDQIDAELEPTHEEVQAAGQLIIPRLTQLLLELLPLLPQGSA